MADRPQPSVEQRDVWPGALWLFALGFVVFVGGSAMVLYFFYYDPVRWTDHRLTRPAPVQQIDPPTDLRAFRAEKLGKLNETGWTDREAGLAAIPIEDAMRLVAKGHRAEVELDREDCTGAACPGAMPSAKTVTREGSP